MSRGRQRSLGVLLLSLIAAVAVWDRGPSEKAPSAPAPQHAQATTAPAKAPSDEPTPQVEAAAVASFFLYPMMGSVAAGE